MSLEKILSGMQISSSGLSGERLRMEVAANNIANAHTTRTPEGGPYRRQRVSFSSVMDHFAQSGMIDGDKQLGGVKVIGVTSDDSPLPLIYDPGHPDANEDGYVAMPNVTLPHEMVDLVTSSRAYEANLKAMETFKQMAEQALALLQGLR
ncbi:flagellar basal body rod protein FlgC [Fuerstiella marisgermanici]|uniref:Flagellar basal-body rod protein FlgC n=1 Tax=Fuerstiella marisgermanici TaxID=1891926 RepID=A0A1P8WJA9_9PLAN|nr:flagellar basal body rod protein FlgC [Fuerstiella marisgermanici]APZ94117.1 Putative proximal rod protein [Fuerstiella marisgermanici]